MVEALVGEEDSAEALVGRWWATPYAGYYGAATPYIGYGYPQYSSAGAPYYTPYSAWGWY